MMMTNLDTTTDFKEEQVRGDTGQLLVIRRKLLSPQGIEESCLRTNIFRSSSTIRGEVCRFMINSCRCTNVILEEAVAKLALFAEPHPTPYKLAWLNTQTDIRISKRCKVPFSIGSSYHDLVCRDVVPMDACHYLLGRPWQFDRQTRHDGFNKSYSFMFESKKIALLPSKDLASSFDTYVTHASPPTATVSDRPVLMLSQSKFEEELRGSDFLFVLMASQPKNCETLKFLPTLNH